MVLTFCAKVAITVLVKMGSKRLQMLQLNQNDILNSINLKPEPFIN